MLELFELDPKDRLIAQLLLSHGLITPEQFQDVAAKARDSAFFSLVELIIGNGLITLEDLEGHLTDYHHKSQTGERTLTQVASSQPDAFSSGEIFLDLHVATNQQMQMLQELQQFGRQQAAAV